MDYEKAYKDALERAKKFKSPYCQATVEQIFPELAESEDERIRKIAIEFVRQNNSFNYYLGICKEQVIAWLEKQGEQNSAWSDEDEKWIDRACMLLDELNHLETLTLAKIPHNLDDIINHLKFLKPQPHWKPTEEQMNELEKLIVWADELYDENSIRTIESLYNNLKKL